MQTVTSLQPYVKDDFIPLPKQPPNRPHEELKLDLKDLACPFRGAHLAIYYYTHVRTLVTLPTDVALVVVHRTCTNEECLACVAEHDFYNTSLDLYALPNRPLALDVILLIGHLTQQREHSLTEQEVVDYLWREHGIQTTQPRVNEYKHLAIALGEAILSTNAAKIKADLDKLPVRVYSIDGLSSNRSRTLFVIRDLFSGAVLGVALLDQHDANTIHAFLEKVFLAFGKPNFLVGDGETGVYGAACQFYPEIPYQYCQRHFLDNLGSALMGDLHEALKNTSTERTCSSTFARRGAN